MQAKWSDDKHKRSRVGRTAANQARRAVRSTVRRKLYNILYGGIGEGGAYTVYFDQRNRARNTVIEAPIGCHPEITDLAEAVSFRFASHRNVQSPHFASCDRQEIGQRAGSRRSTARAGARQLNNSCVVALIAALRLFVSASTPATSPPQFKLSQTAGQT